MLFAVNGVIMANDLCAVGMSRDERTLLSSMLSIIRIKAGADWQLVGPELGSVYLVNVDSQIGRAFLEGLPATTKVIHYTRFASAKQNDVFTLASPIRARELLRALEAYQQNASVLSKAGSWIKRLA